MSILDELNQDSEELIELGIVEVMIRTEHKGVIAIVDKVNAILDFGFLKNFVKIFILKKIIICKPTS